MTCINVRKKTLTKINMNTINSSNKSIDSFYNL